MKNKDKNKSFNLFDFTIILILIFYKYLGFYNLTEKKNIYIIVLIVMGLMTIYLIKLKMKKKELVTIVLIFIACAYSTYISGAIDFIISFLLALIFYKRDEKNFIKYFFISSICCYILTIVLYNLGVLNNNSIKRITEEGTVVRNSLGFAHVNGVFKHLISIILAGYLLIDDKYLKRYSIVVFVISTILYTYSASRTGYLCTILFLIIANFFNITKFKIVRKYSKYTFLILTILTILIALKFGVYEDDMVNELLSNRPYIWNYYIRTGKLLSMFGTEIQGSFFVIDNVYLTYLVAYGIITYIIYFILNFISYSIIKENRKVLLVFIIFAIYGIFETLSSYYTNFALVLQLIYIMRYDFKEKNDITSKD